MRGSEPGRRSQRATTLPLSAAPTSRLCPTAEAASRLIKRSWRCIDEFAEKLNALPTDLSEAEG